MEKEKVKAILLKANFQIDANHDFSCRGHLENGDLTLRCIYIEKSKVFHADMIHKIRMEKTIYEGFIIEEPQDLIKILCQNQLIRTHFPAINAALKSSSAP